jgi:hypothetical protein
VFLGLALIVLIIIINSGINSCKRNNSEGNKTLKGSASPSAPSKAQPVGKQKTLYRFSDYPNGRFTVTLNSDAEFYPKGGKIKIQTPAGEIWDDELGTAHDRPPQTGGPFTFWANDSIAWGVEIWN